MAHSHSHSHTGHSHGVSPGADSKRLTIGLSLILGFMAVEFTAGAISHSLALISDGAHMLTDAIAIALSLAAIKVAQKPAKGSLTFGWRRVEILATVINGAALIVIGVVIAIEAIGRLIAPPTVDAPVVLATSIVGMIVNVAAVMVLARANRENINIEGSYQHILTDLFAFIGTAIAAGVIIATGFERADPFASLVVCALMLRSGSRLVWESGRILLEAAPRGIDPREVGATLANHPEVKEVHDLHIWELSSGFPSLSAHILVGEVANCHRIREELSTRLMEKFHIDHVTLQVEHLHNQFLTIKLPEKR